MSSRISPAPEPQRVSLELGLDEPSDPDAVRAAVARALDVDVDELGPVVMRKRSLDCRRGRIRFHLLLDVLSPGASPPGTLAEPSTSGLGRPPDNPVRGEPEVVIVGDGPCGLFCAYELARRGVAALVIDRGKKVQPRRRDLKGLTRHGKVDEDSNYCFGEGGAGTYSDGKLYTRSHKRGDVRDVLEILALHGAPGEILVDARPHIGSNRLPEVVQALRERLESVGVRFSFGARVTDVVRSGGRVRGVALLDGSLVHASHVVLATGHSARDVYRLLHEGGHRLQPKAFALGVRVEHPQSLINQIQYGSSAGHARLPSAAYRLTDSRGDRPVFSFCMCPGGFMVPACTEQRQIVLNGMSPSRRNSRFANSGIVVGVEPASLETIGLSGPLAGIELQRRIEEAAFVAGGGNLVAPATRLADFCDGKSSSDLPNGSYVPGLSACDVADVLDVTGIAFSSALRASLRHFDRQLRGYLTNEAVVSAVESRSSAPVRIPRDPHTLESTDWPGLFPAGEGAGYAGGIVSAAVDGIRVARQIARVARSRSTAPHPRRA